MSVEQAPETQAPSIDWLAQRTLELVRDKKEFVEEKVPECEAFCERNPVAMEEFLKKFLQTETV